jgi:uncharacterized protein YjbI with pentapeptide repeats
MAGRSIRGGRVVSALAVVVAFLLGGATYGAVRLAGASGSNTTYYACLSTRGTLSKVGTVAPTCKTGTTQISWNSTGPQGPPGATGPQGPAAACAGMVYEGADFGGCDLSGINFTGYNLTGTNLTNANLTNATLTNANLAGTGLNGAALAGVLSGGITGTPSALPTGWILAIGYLMGPGANLSGAKFSFTPCASLQGVNLTSANLSGATLWCTDLSGAHLSGVNLSNAWLAGVNLSGADLSGALFRDDTLSDINLNSVQYKINFTGANVTGATWSNTQCPDGTNSNNDGNTCVGHGGGL